MLVGGGADHLHIHVHGVGDFLHAAFDDIGDAELLADLAQIVRRAFVLLGRRSGDHLQVGYLREAGEDFVLNSFREIGVLLFIAEVFEGQDSDRLLRDDRRCRRFGASHTGSISGRVTTDNNQSDRSHHTNDHDINPSVTFPASLRGQIDIFRTLQSFWGEFKSPRDHERDRKSDDDCEHD